jgi:outer membrane lipoprotein-sorting protein
MRFLRTTSTARLVALCAGAVAVAAGGTAIAVAGGSGPVPRAKPLAQAVHDAATAPETQGITADVKFTNHLVDSSGIQGSNPLLSGATGRLWVSPGKGLRLELQSPSGGDAQIVASPTGFQVYDGTSNTLYSGTFPADTKDPAGTQPKHQVPSIAKIQAEIARLGQHLSVSGANPSDVGGRPAYTVRVTPKQSGGLVGAAELAWDAAHGVPLRAALYARGNNNPVLELAVTNISFGAVKDSIFQLTPPADAKKVDVTGGSKGAAPDAKGKDKSKGKHKPVTGAAAVAKKLPFQLSAPATLAGLPRTQVRLLQLKDSPAALVTYGTGPGTIAVLERAHKADAAAKKAPAPPGEHHGDGQVQLPTVKIGAATANVLDTPLGSIVSFSRGGVTYTVVGSVPAAVSETAARGL